MKVSADYRMLALDALRGKWKTAVLTGIAASALGATIVSSSNSAVSNSNQAKDIHFELFAQPNGGRLLKTAVSCAHASLELPGTQMCIMAGVEKRFPLTPVKQFCTF